MTKQIPLPVLICCADLTDWFNFWRPSGLLYSGCAPVISILICRRLLELHSPDGQHTVVLRCKDAPTANSWFTAMHTNIAALLPQVLAHINAYLGASLSAPTHPHLKHIGWLAEQVCKAHSHPLAFTPVLIRTFVNQTGRMQVMFCLSLNK